METDGAPPPQDERMEAAGQGDVEELAAGFEVTLAANAEEENEQMEGMDNAGLSDTLRSDGVEEGETIDAPSASVIAHDGAVHAYASII